MTRPGKRTTPANKRKSSGRTAAAGRCPEVSIVLPVYNGQDFIRDNVVRLDDFCRSRIRSYEIIVVDDGSRDKTRDILKGLSRRSLRTVSYETNRGKFGALAAGMALARGRCCVFTDADLPYELSALPYVAGLVNDRGFHIVIGDRNLPESVYDIRTSWLRNVSTRVFSLFVTVLVTGGLFDTQCGLKGFRGDVARSLFPLVTDHGFSGDVELLYIALKYNLEIKRIPVRLESHGPSTVKLFSQAWKMLGRISQLRLNWNRGRYDSKVLKRISSQPY